MEEGKLEYVRRQLEDRTETLKAISDGSAVSVRAIRYMIENKDSEEKGGSVKTINRLFQYFQQKGKK